MTVRARQDRPTGELFYVEPQQPMSVVHKVANKPPPLGQRLFWTQAQAEVERDYVDGVPPRQHRVSPHASYDGSLGVGPGEAYTVTAGRPPVEEGPRQVARQLTIALTAEEWSRLEPAFGAEKGATWARRVLLAQADLVPPAPKERKKWMGT